MPRTPEAAVETTSGTVEVYTPTARAYHWIVVALIAVQVPVGFYMAYRGNVLNIWDGATNALYSGHKLAGLAILVIVVLRLAYRLGNGAPRPEPSLEPWQVGASELTHWLLYALLIVMPVLGYLGVSYYPALDVFGLFKLPALVSPDKGMAETVFYLHMLGGFLIVGLIGLHVGAALYHHLVRGDNVLGRMLPSALRKV
ncbi:MAG: cytochrome b [Hyphomicrobiaceae bacterium]|nr:cytochrome b [Hyphomicrobiaceae bacterium]